MITFLYTVCKTILHYFLTFLRGRFLWHSRGIQRAPNELQRRCSGLPAPCPVLQWLFSGAAMACLRPARCCPSAAITNFFQSPRETLKFQPSIFWHCENLPKYGHSEPKLSGIPMFYRDFTAIFTNCFFQYSQNPWYIRARNTYWVILPFFRDYGQPDNEYSHTNSDCMQPDNEYSRQTATVQYSYLRRGWSNRCFQLLASTSIEFNPRNRCFSRVDLKHFKFQKNCYNKYQKLL